MPAKYVRCEADYKDGGVCLTKHRSDFPCPNRKDHWQSEEEK